MTLLITLGEPAGIGPDVMLLAQQKNSEAFHGCVVVSPLAWLQQRAQLLAVDVALVEHSTLAQASDACHDQAGIHCWNPEPQLADGPVLVGHPAAVTADAVVACIRHAAQACLRGEARAMVTAPIEKAVLRNAGFAFPGHTEFLADLAAKAKRSDQQEFAMMLASSVLRVVLLTTHMALRDVPDALSVSETLRILRITHDDLQRRFGIAQPRIAVCGLNPHAGEQGHFGNEESTLLTPAILEARALGMDIADVMPADTLFSAQMRPQFDAVICCYHDQGLIPIKALSFGDAVNVTLGMPFIRTSVDHGTALDRAGTGNVHCGSLLQATLIARSMVEHESVPLQA
ncbi:MAG: 4-hydroxythreonine-4-phosphate dehydrogenase PdxA [Mariprofundaceae bacterium]|nr:4-hydroxythreonine-4-phosphate dehydrogenase PdxA [Mariprofundaceae bacterium]